MHNSRNEAMRERSDAASSSDGDPLAAYLRSISNIPVLEPERVDELLRDLGRLRARARSSERPADWNACQRLKNEIVLHHLRLVVSCALRFRHGPVSLLDLIQEGNLGLMDAVDHFDPDRGVRLSTYAFWRIRRKMLGAIENGSRTVRLPRHVSNLQAQVRKIEAECGRRGFDLPSDADLAERLGCTLAALRRQEQSRNAALSLDQPADATGMAWIERLHDASAPRPDSAIAKRWLEQLLASELAGIDPRARHVIEMRFGLFGARALTLDESGRRLGISGERVRQIERGAIAALRRCGALQALIGEFD